MGTSLNEDVMRDFDAERAVREGTSGKAGRLLRCRRAGRGACGVMTTKSPLIWYVRRFHLVAGRGVCRPSIVCVTDACAD